MERLTWKCAFDGEAHCQDGHERLVGHRVDHSPDDRLLIPPPGDVPVDEIRQPGVCKEPDGPGMLVVKDEVADDGRRHESGDFSGGFDVEYTITLLLKGVRGHLLQQN
jgi:hypothetical protein